MSYTYSSLFFRTRILSFFPVVFFLFFFWGEALQDHTVAHLHFPSRTSLGCTPSTFLTGLVVHVLPLDGSRLLSR